MAGTPRNYREVAAVYGAGLLQGLALVTFPAASSVFTDRAAFGLSSGQYGYMFVPQTVLAIAAALLGVHIERRWGEKRVFLAGLVANLASMALLLGSRFVMHDHATAYPVLLGATALMGIGFGLTVPALNTLASALFPRKVDVAVLALNALLGLGTALAPLLVALFVGVGAWWGLPLTVGVLLAALLAWSVPLPLAAAAAPAAKAIRSKRYWLFAAFGLGYGAVETLNGNWAILYMKGVLHAPAALAAIALTLFWAAATVGRIVFASIEHWMPARATFRVLPWVVGAAFIVTALVTDPGMGAASFAIAGLGCSALLPLMISLGASDAPPGHLIAFYQMGYGLAAFGVDPLRSATGLGMRPLFGGASVIALLLALLAVVLVGLRHEPSGRARTAEADAADAAGQ